MQEQIIDKVMKEVQRRIESSAVQEKVDKRKLNVRISILV